MNHSHHFRQRALWTVHTVRTVHHPATPRICAQTVRLAQRPQSLTGRPPTVQLGRDVGTRANVGRDVADVTAPDGSNGSFAGNCAEDRSGNSRAPSFCLLRART